MYIFTGKFEMTLHHGLQMCFQNVPSFACKRPFPHSHVCGFSLSSRNTSVCPNLSDQKGVTSGLWSHLSESLVTIIYRSSERSDEKGRKPGSYNWYEIQDKTEFYENFEKPKLIWAEMNREISFCYDESNYFVNNKCFFITSDEIDLKFLNGLHPRPSRKKAAPIRSSPSPAIPARSNS